MGGDPVIGRGVVEAHHLGKVVGEDGIGKLAGDRWTWFGNFPVPLVDFGFEEPLVVADFEGSRIPSWIEGDMEDVLWHSCL